MLKHFNRYDSIEASCGFEIVNVASHYLNVRQLTLHRLRLYVLALAV